MAFAILTNMFPELQAQRLIPDAKNLIHFCIHRMESHRHHIKIHDTQRIMNIAGSNPGSRGGNDS